MRNDNLEIRIAGSSCRPQVVLRKMLSPILGVFVSKPSGNILYVMFDKYFVT